MLPTFLLSEDEGTSLLVKPGGMGIYDTLSLSISLLICQEDTLGSSQMQDLYAEGPVD